MKTALQIFVAIMLTSVLGLGLGGCDNAPANGIDPAELIAHIQNDNAPLILDVRTESEFVVSHIPGAVNIPHTEVNKRLAELPIDKSAEIVIYCTRGVRAASVEDILIVAGYQHIKMLNGHFAEWSKLELPVAQGVTR